MVKFDFPASPVPGQAYQPPGGPGYVYDGERWKGAGVPTVIVHHPQEVLYLSDFGAYGNDNPALLIDETDKIKTAILTANAERRELLVRATNYMISPILIDVPYAVSMRGFGGKPVFRPAPVFTASGTNVELLGFFNTAGGIPGGRTLTQTPRYGEKLLHLSTTANIVPGFHYIFLTSNTEWYYDARDNGWNKGEAHLITRVLDANTIEVADFVRDEYSASGETVSLDIRPLDWLRLENLGFYSPNLDDPASSKLTTALAVRNAANIHMNDIDADNFTGTGIYMRKVWHPTLDTIRVSNITSAPEGSTGVGTGGGTVGFTLRNLVARGMRHAVDFSQSSASTAGGPTRDCLVDSFDMRGGGVDQTGLAYEPEGSCNITGKVGTFNHGDILTGGTSGYKVRLTWQSPTRLQFEQLGEYSLTNGETLTNGTGGSAVVSRIHTNYTSKPVLSVGMHGGCEGAAFTNGRISNVGNGVMIRGRNTVIRNVQFEGRISTNCVGATYGEGIEIDGCSYNRNDNGERDRLNSSTPIIERGCPVFLELGNSSATNSWLTALPTVIRNVTATGLRQHFIRLNPGMASLYNLFVSNVDCEVRSATGETFRFIGSKTDDATVKTITRSTFRGLSVRPFGQSGQGISGTWNWLDSTIKLGGGRVNTDDNMQWENTHIFTIPEGSNSRVRAFGLMGKDLVLSLQTYDAATGVEYANARGMFRLTRLSITLVDMGEIGSAVAATNNAGAATVPGKIRLYLDANGYLQVDNTMGTEVIVHIAILN